MRRSNNVAQFNINKSACALVRGEGTATAAELKEVGELSKTKVFMITLVSASTVKAWSLSSCCDDRAVLKLKIMSQCFMPRSVNLDATPCPRQEFVLKSPH